jgi:hypothetical protein
MSVLNLTAKELDILEVFCAPKLWPNVTIPDNDMNVWKLQQKIRRLKYPELTQHRGDKL